MKTIVDRLLGTALEYATLVFPMNTPGSHTSRKGEGNHWTLLRYHLCTSAWTFYNSMQPRCGGVDPYFKSAKDMASFCFTLLYSSFSETEYINISYT